MDWAPLSTDERRDVRLTAEAEASLSSPSAPSSDASLGYDAQNRVKSMTTVTDGRTTNYTYYKDDLLHRVINPNGDVATSTYDDAGRIDTLVTANGATTVSSYDYGYDTNGNRTSQIEILRGVAECSPSCGPVEAPPELTTYAYDNANRLKRVTYPADATYPQGRVATYTYDKAGNRVGERETTTEDALIIERIGAFDANNRLTSLSSTGVSAGTGEDTRVASYAFGYDNNGNEIQRTSTTQHTPTAQGDPRPATVVTTNSTYDLSDRLVEQGRAVAEQVEGNPVEATVIIARHEYDGEGRRTKKIGEEGIRQYVYDDTSILAEYDTNGLEIAKYDYGADRLIRLTRTDEDTRYFSFDGLGSVTSLTTLSGTVAASYRLDAWGQFRFEAELAPSKNRFGYTGHYWDKESNLYYAKARYYDPFTARFTQSDSFLGNIDVPPSLHRYQYAHANPTSYWDPTGYEILPASCYTGGNCDARKSSGPIPEERALIRFAVDTAKGMTSIIGTTAVAIDPITAIRQPETAQFARDRLSEIPGQVRDGISDWGRDVGTISANPSVVIDAIEDLGEERAREAYFGGVLMSATLVQGGSQLVRSGGSLGATAVSEARTAIPALRQSIREFSDRLYWKPIPSDLLRGTTIGTNGAGAYRATLGRIGLRATDSTKGSVIPAGEIVGGAPPFRPGRTLLNELDIDYYGNFNTRPRVGDPFAGHEMLQNAWLKGQDLVAGRGVGLASSRNPALAVRKALHDRIYLEQKALKLLDPSRLRVMSGVENIRLNALAMRRAGVPEHVIQMLQREAEMHLAQIMRNVW